MAGGRFRELLKKYGKVALGVHLSVSAASISGLYIAIKNNVDVESVLSKLPFGGVSEENKKPDDPQTTDGFVMTIDEDEKLSEGSSATVEVVKQQRNRTAELVASSGGALALAVVCNKALFPIRVPITIALTPPIARFLARRRIIKSSL